MVAGERVGFMMWLSRQFGRAVVRRVAFLVVAALFALLASWDASAQQVACLAGQGCTITTAAQMCASATAGGLAETNRQGPNVCQRRAGENRFVCTFPSKQGNGTPYNAGCGYFYYTGGCPAPLEFNDFTNSCDVACSSKSPLGPTVGLLQSEVCVDGCKYSGLPSFQVSVESGPPGAIDFGGFEGFTPTGAYCAAGSPNTASPDPECAPINGQTVCVRADGQHCAKSSTRNKYFCWKPGETGEKTDGPEMSKTNAGDTPIPPSLSLPSGDTLVPMGDSYTTTTIDNSVGSTSTSTTHQYGTQHGTDAGPGNPQGEGGSDGPGKGDGSGGDGEGDGKGSMTGGSSCADPPSCIGGDPVLCGLLKVQHMTGCLAEDGIREFMGESYDETDGTEGVDPGDLIADEDYDATSVDDSGFGFGRTCPSPPSFYDTTLDNDAMCNLLQWIGVMIAALGLLQAAYVLGGER